MIPAPGRGNEEVRGYDLRSIELIKLIEGIPFTIIRSQNAPLANFQNKETFVM